jgi:hypothetical protein
LQSHGARSNKFPVSYLVITNVACAVLIRHEENRRWQKTLNMPEESFSKRHDRSNPSTWMARALVESAMRVITEPDRASEHRSTNEQLQQWFRMKSACSSSEQQQHQQL